MLGGDVVEGLILGTRTDLGSQFALPSRESFYPASELLSTRGLQPLGPWHLAGPGQPCLRPRFRGGPCEPFSVVGVRFLPGS